jgi:serine/threonine protein kinase
VEQESFAAGLVGVVLDGRYRLDALLGEGGMGAVYRAHHLAMDRKVAVKLLKPHLTSDDAALQRFAREARSTLKVDSPHAVKVLDFGVTPQRDYYMVLEYLDGRTVQRELDVDGPFAPGRVVHIARQALHALGAAHRQGLVHRDIKPENILLMRVGDDADYAKLLDFGVAKLMEGAAQSERSKLSITQQGMVFGTPEFMSPEQACGQALDPRSDLYSLAATMFGMLTGCGMYQASTPLEWLLAHARKPPPHLADGLADLARYSELDALLQRCFAKHRDQRPQTADELDQLLAALEPTLESSPHIAQATAQTLLPGRVMRPAASAYVEALPSDTLEPLLLPRRRRGLWIAIGALVVVGMIATAIVLATRKGTLSPLSTSPPPKVDKGESVPFDAAEIVRVEDAKVMDAATPLQPAIVREPPPPVVPHGNPEVAQHLAAAEDAKRAGNRLRQIAEADAVLRLDAHNVRARLLIADGLLATGSIDSGCKYLRSLGRNPTALQMAKAASCPSD